MSETQDRDFDDRYIPSDTEARTFKARRWVKIQGRTPMETIDAIKAELNANGTVTAMINIFDSFDHFRAVGSNYTYSPRAGESADSSMVHMVSIVGYDDRDRTWIMRNSFGRSFGLNGFLKVR
jgi:C1A family cysteine protease